jgi:putative endonuclease
VAAPERPDPQSPAAQRQERRARLGNSGEAAAVEELERRGYSIRTRNYRCRGGEADVVAEEDGCLVFVEVKTRAELRHGLPREAVGWTKQQRLGVAAQHYCDQYDCENYPVRFDVVEVVMLHGQVAAVEVIPDAFTPE